MIAFNPLEYYNLSCPIIQKLPGFSQNLNSTLLQLKKWNDLINWNPLAHSAAQKPSLVLVFL